MKTLLAEPRAAALSTLTHTRQGTPLESAMESAMGDLPPRDRRLAHEIAAGVLRHLRMIDREIQRHLDRPAAKLDDDVRDILRIGTYQLKYLDRVPPYAAVSSAVDLARRRRKHAAALVNAVLRQVARSPTPIDCSECSVAERHSHPDWLVERWHGQFGMGKTEALLSFFNTKPPIVIQAARWNEEMLADALRKMDIGFRMLHPQPGIVIETGDVDGLPGYGEGAFIVQDPAQRSLLDYASIPRDELVWDACAAPGGKAVTLALRGRLVATDASQARVAVLRKNRDRVAPDMRIIVADAVRAPFRAASLDTVVVDAPCSGTGTMARHPDARWSLTPEKIQRAVARQRELLDACAQTVKKGGLLVYLTCSIERVENEEQVDWFLAAHPDFQRTCDDLSIFPPDCGTDGGFGARLRRQLEG